MSSYELQSDHSMDPYFEHPGFPSAVNKWFGQFDEHNGGPGTTPRYTVVSPDDDAAFEEKWQHMPPTGILTRDRDEDPFSCIDTTSESELNEITERKVQYDLDVLDAYREYDARERERKEDEKDNRWQEIQRRLSSRRGKGKR